MSAIENITEKRIDEVSECEPQTIRCYLDVALILRTRRMVLSGKRLLAAQALGLVMRLDAELIEARADWNQDRFRRLMQARFKAALRVMRRWSGLNPAPLLPLGSLRRRYHANLAGHLNEGTK
jgi:hypothetical protein